MVRRRPQHGAWELAAWATTALGLACVFVLWGLWQPLTTMFGVFVPVFVVAVLAEDRSAWSSVRIAFKVGLLVLACAGLVAAFGWSGALLVLLVAATSPVVRLVLSTFSFDAVRRGTVASGRAQLRKDSRPLVGRGVGPEGPGSGSLRNLLMFAEMPDGEGVPALDDPALCQAWRRSYLLLEESPAAGTRLEVVRLRQLYLDELVCRHPAEVQHWLASGARAAGNPLPFLRRPVRQGVRFEYGEPPGDLPTGQI